jgi:hypothetical protein
MKELHDRINRVINTCAFEQTLEKEGIALFQFQGKWARYASKGGFDSLPAGYRRAIIAGEKELSKNGVLAIA